MQGKTLAKTLGKHGGLFTFKEDAMNAKRVTCIKNEGYPVSLVLGNTYDTLFDEEDKDIRDHGYIRVIEETGEDYLFPASYFVGAEPMEDPVNRGAGVYV